MADVVLELQDAKPVRILDARGIYFEFDDEGRVDEHLRHKVADRLDIAFAPRAKPKGSVIDLVPPDHVPIALIVLMMLRYCVWSVLPVTNRWPFVHGIALT